MTPAISEAMVEARKPRKGARIVSKFENADETKTARISVGRAIIAALWSGADRPRPEHIAAHDVDELRDCIRKNFGSHEARGLVREIDTEQYDPGYVTRSVDMTPAQVRTLFRLAGFPMIDADWHGQCEECVYGPDRGWGAPCSGCGFGHPCFTPRETLGATP